MKAVKFLFDADMRGGHDMLVKQAKSIGVDLSRLKENEATVFINRNKDKIKAYSYNKVMTYIRFLPEDNRKIDMGALMEIARAFNSKGVLEYDKALKASLIQRLKEKRTRKAALSII